MCYLFQSPLKNLLSNERTRWILDMVAVALGFAEGNVISCPHERLLDNAIQVNFLIVWYYEFC